VAARHDREQGTLALQTLDVGERVAVDEEQIGEVTGLDLTQFVVLVP
jgi:hypothetical protein